MSRDARTRREQPLRAAVWPLLVAGASMASVPACGADAGTESNLPLWEAGAGIGAVTIPAYKGSDVTRTYFAPLPFVVYRGETLRANRDGVGLSMIGADNWKLDLSLSGSIPVESSGTARNGMRNVPFIAEVGPVLKYKLYETTDEQWQLRLPLRYAMHFHLKGPEGVGWISDPGLWVTKRTNWFGVPLEWGTSLSVDLQSASYDNFYYGVGAADATATRPAYHSAGGYGGVDLRSGLWHRSGDFIVAGFIGASDISGASFGDSPLVTRTTGYYGGISLIWVIQKSEQKAARVREPGQSY